MKMYFLWMSLLLLTGWSQTMTAQSCVKENVTCEIKSCAELINKGICTPAQVEKCKKTGSCQVKRQAVSDLTKKEEFLSGKSCSLPCVKSKSSIGYKQAVAALLGSYLHPWRTT